MRAGQAVESGGTYAVRCNIDNQQYRVGSLIKGDTARDFTVEMAVAARGRTGPLDSMDFLNLLTALHQRHGVEIPDADARRLATIDAATAYLSGKAPKA